MEQHRFDVISFLFGALFVGAGLSAVFFGDTFTRIDGRWVWPAVLLIAGVAVLTATMRSGRDNEPAESAAFDAETTPDGPVS